VRAIKTGQLHGVVRDMLTRLRPPMLNALGLEASLRAGRWSQLHGIACSVVSTPAANPGRRARVTLYRVAQEAANVARHAGAAQVQLVLEPEPDVSAF
jgi:two-component system sensor histidine kinase UhpB